MALVTVLALGWLAAFIFDTWAYLASESQARRQVYGYAHRFFLGDKLGSAGA